MKGLFNRHIADISEATEENDHTTAVLILACVAEEVFVERKLREIIVRHKDAGSISEQDIAERTMFRKFLIGLFEGDALIDELEAAF